MLIGPDGQRIGAGQIDRAATLSRINKRLDPRPMSSTAAPAQHGLRPGIGARPPAPVPARAGKPALAKPLENLTAQKRGKAKPKGMTTQAVETTVQLIERIATGAGGPLIGGGKRRKGSAAGLIGKTMRPIGGRRLGL